jgi:hypothetical protein
MLTSVLIKLGLVIFSALPIERILAVLLNKWIGKIEGGKVDAAADIAAKAGKTAEHLAELSALFADILKDRAVGAEEVGMMRDTVSKMRKALLDIWSRGETAKATQSALAKMGVDADYVEPLLKVNGCARIGVLCAVALASLSLAALLAGCGTATRCQTMTFEGCYIVVNEPSNLENPSYPRSMQIGVQDQQIEGGTDTIASGNPATPTVTIPLGDSGIGAVAGMIEALLPAKEAAPTNAAVPATP